MIPCSLEVKTDIFTSKRPIATKFDGVVAYDKRLLQIKIAGAFDQVFMWGHATNEKWCISIPKTPTSTKLDKGVASHIVMRHFDQMITWNHVTTKNVRSVSIKPMITKRGQGGGLQQRTTNDKVTWPFSHVVRSRNKLK